MKEVPLARPNTHRKIQRYSAEFKLRAVKLTDINGIQVKDVAAALDIHPFMLSRWRKEVRDGLIQDKVKPKAVIKSTAGQKLEVRELARIKRDYALLKEEHELLKKAIRFCSDPKNRSLRSSPRSRTSSA